MRRKGFGYFFLCKMYGTMFTDSLAGTTLVGSVAKVAELTVLDAVLVAVTLADEFEGNLHLLCKSQGLYLDGVRLALFRAALRCHTDVERDLGMKAERRLSERNTEVCRTSAKISKVKSINVKLST